MTICTHNHEHFLGQIVVETRFIASVETQFNAFVETRFIPSQIGQSAQKFWYQIPDHFPFVKLDEFVVMPNHVHEIIVIDQLDGNGCDGRRDKSRLYKFPSIGGVPFGRGGEMPDDSSSSSC